MSPEDWRDPLGALFHAVEEGAPAAAECTRAFGRFTAREVGGRPMLRTLVVLLVLVLAGCDDALAPTTGVESYAPQLAPPVPTCGPGDGCFAGPPGAL